MALRGEVKLPVVGSALGIALFVAPMSRAQAVPPEKTAASPIDVVLRAEEPAGIRLELYDPNELPPRDLPAVVCFDACRFQTVPGRYLLRVSGPPRTDVRASRRYLDLDESSVVSVDPPSSAAYYMGLALGILGPIVFASGFLVANQSEPGEEHTFPTAGGALILTGLIATPVGWVMFGSNRRPGADISTLVTR